MCWGCGVSPAWDAPWPFRCPAAGIALQSFSPIDWIFICLILWGLSQGSRKGFSDMFGKLLGIFLISMLTLSLYSQGAAYLNATLPAELFTQQKPANVKELPIEALGG